MDLKEIDCSRCCFWNDQAGRQETQEYLTAYLQLCKTIVEENEWIKPSISTFLEIIPLSGVHEESF
jgi:hypothetical protein